MSGTNERYCKYCNTTQITSPQTSYAINRGLCTCIKEICVQRPARIGTMRVAATVTAVILNKRDLYKPRYCKHSSRPDQRWYGASNVPKLVPTKYSRRQAINRSVSYSKRKDNGPRRQRPTALVKRSEHLGEDEEQAQRRKYVL